MKDHFMIGQHVRLECTDGRSRWLIIDEVADRPLAPSEPLTDAEQYGLWLWGTDATGVRRLANVAWTHAAYIQAPDDDERNPCRGWVILDSQDRMIEFVDQAHYDTLSHATGARYPWALGDSAQRRDVTIEAYKTLRETAGTR